MPAIRIRVGAALDANATDVFIPLIVAAKRARLKVSEELNAGAKVLAGPYRTNARAAAASTDMITASSRKMGHALSGAAVDAQGKFQDLSKGLKRLPADLATVARVAQQELAKIERAKARTALGLPTGPRSYSDRFGGVMQRASGRLATHLAMSAMSLPMRAIGGALGMAASAARGIGVETDFGSMVQANTANERRATDVSNAGYMPGQKGANGQRQDPARIMSQARSVANATGIATDQALSGLQDFVGKTGDLETGRDILKDMAVLSKATGTHLSDMVSAAGDVSNQLGDIPNKGEAVSTIMKMIAGQGKLGAVEIRNMATQMAKIAAGASMFEGGAAKNIGTLGAIAQEARQRGGAASATQAATSVSSFTNIFSKRARLGAFKAMGVNVNGDGGIRDPRLIIQDAIMASAKKSVVGGKLQSDKFNANMGGMFMDVRARSATKGFETTFQQAYSASTGKTEQEKLAAGAAAVSAEFDRLTSQTMANAEIQASFQAAMSTTESKVAVFNNKMQEVASEVMVRLLPAFEQLAPVILDVASKLPKLLDWLTDKKEGNKDNVEMGLGALNTQNQTAAALRGAYGVDQNANGGAQGLVPAGLLERGAEQIAALDAAIAEKKKQIADNTGPAAASLDPDAIGVGAGETTEDSERRTGELANLQSSRDTLENLHTKLADALSNKTLRVMVVNQVTPQTRPPDKRAPAPVPMSSSATEQ